MEKQLPPNPGYFQSELKRKAESAGGSFTKFSTQKTALSQTHDWSTNQEISAERVHYDSCGVVMHRDLFMFLARYVDEDQLSLRDACCVSGMEFILLEAWQCYQQSANLVALLNVGRLIRP